ncbi:MAG: RtcB family protein [Patescibacteria group bacterium]
MFTLTGKYNTAQVFAAALEQTAVAQIIELLNQEFVRESNIRIMPDAHAGAGCVIGTTMTLHDKVVPNLVGVDIGCAVRCALLCGKPDFKKLDRVIREHIPAGFEIRRSKHRLLDHRALMDLKCAFAVNLNRADLSIGTLGGGNHFIEVDVDTAGRYWLLIHSGSRNLGKQVAEYYQNEAIKQRATQDYGQQALIAKLRAENRAAEISDELKKLNAPKIPKYLAYCDGDLFNDYIHDMEIVQEYARVNRAAIVETIDDEMEFVDLNDGFETVHNYIETGLHLPMLRKGAVAAHVDQRLVIPLNMRDGTLLCRGKGNPDWNESAPHGAGRLMGRAEAKRRLTVEQYEKSMNGIYTTCVGRATLDEAPAAYKPAEEILAQIGATVEVMDHWMPVYNFKSDQ